MRDLAKSAVRAGDPFGRSRQAPPLSYNVAVAVLFLVLRFADGMSGVGLWPVIALHAEFAVWCATCLAARRMA